MIWTSGLNYKEYECRIPPCPFKRLKKLDVKIKKSFKERIKIFEKDPHNPQLNNHALKREYEGYRSIDITADWRAIFEVVQDGEESFAYFIALDTHEHLYTR